MADNQSIQAAVDEVSRRLDLARDRGDMAGEADALSRRSALAVAMGELDRAIADLERSGALYFKLNDPAAEARVSYGRGLLLGREPSRSSEAESALRRSASLAYFVRDPVQEMRAWQQIVQLRERRGDADGALDQLGAMILRLDELGNVRGQVDCLRHVAALEQLRGRAHVGLLRLNAALEKAQSLSDPALVLQVRFEIRALQTASGLVPSGSERWDDLITSATELGESQLLGLAKIQQAAESLRHSNPSAALTVAMEARQHALGATEPLSYLLASLLMAEAQEALGDHAGVIGTLLSCKSTLEKHLGQDAGRSLVWILDSLERRWGAPQLERALIEHRDRAANRA